VCTAFRARAARAPVAIDATAAHGSRMATKKKTKTKTKKKPAWQQELAKTKGGDRDAAFERLKAILKGVAQSADLVVVHDTPKGMLVSCANVTWKGQPMFFGSVAKVKSYVSYYLMGVYVWPDLVDKLSPALKKRMQGKSCFNFNSFDATLFKELASFTEKTRKAFATRKLP
jgi:hypothetical protein